MVQKVLKDMVIIAELWPQAFAAIHTVEFHYEIMQSLCPIVLQLGAVSLSPTSLSLSLRRAPMARCASLGLGD